MENSDRLKRGESEDAKGDILRVKIKAITRGVDQMQMVNCDKCGKAIDHTHRFQVFIGCSVTHIDCDDPFGDKLPTKYKTIPDFSWELRKKGV
jgi:hypothetical protein